MKRISPTVPWLVSAILFFGLLDPPGSGPLGNEQSLWAYLLHMLVFIALGWSGSRLLTERNHCADLKTEMIRTKAVMDQYLTASNAMVISLSLDGVIAFANANAAAAFGLSSEQMAGRQWVAEFVPQSMRSMVREEFGHILSGTYDGPRQIEIPIKCEGQNVRRITWHHTAWRGMKGETLGILGWGKDVTARRGMEDRVQDSEWRLAAILGNSPAIIYLKDTAGRYTLVNDNYCELIGKPRDKIIGKLESEFQQGSAEKTDARDRAVLQSAKTIVMEESVNVSGVDRRFSVYRFPLLGDSGQAFGAGVIAFDTTAQKAVEEALRVSEEQYRHLVENPGINYVVFVRGTDGKFTYISPSVHQVLGYYPNDLVGETDRFETDAPINTEARRLTGLSIKGIRQQAYEIEMTHRNGFAVTLEVTEVPLFNNDDSVRAVQGIAHNVTERKRTAKVLQETKHQLNSALESFADGIALFDSKSQFVLSNGAFATTQPFLSEFLKPGVLLEAIVEEMFLNAPFGGSEPEDADIRQPSVHELVSKRELEYSHGGRWYQLKLYPTREGGVALVREEITARHQLERELVLSQKLKAVGQLTGGVAHDFNNILAVVLGNLQLIEEEAGTKPELGELVQNAIKAVERGGQLTEQLLAFSRRQSLRPQIVDPNLLLAGMIQMLQRTLGEDITIETRLMSDAVTVKIDSAALENAILNVAINARAAMPRGGRLIVESRAVQFARKLPGPDGELPAGSYVALAITDTGVGMTEDVASRAFEPFFTTKEVGSGSGLGLSMVYGFAKQSGGHASISTELGQGSSISLFLPIVEDEEPKEALQANNVSDLYVGSGTILVVEDDEQLRTITVQSIRSLGFTVFEAENGKSALDVLANNESVDLVFSDIVMPGGMNGGQLAKEIAQLYRDIPVVLATGYPDRGGVVSEDLPNGVPILNKPYSRHSLSDMLRSVFEDRDVADL